MSSSLAVEVAGLFLVFITHDKHPQRSLWNKGRTSIQGASPVCALCEADSPDD